MRQIFEDDDFYSGPVLTSGLLEMAESALSVKLPSAYIELLGERNGGIPRACCMRTDFATSWTPNHLEIRAILGVGGEWGIDSITAQGSKDMGII